jgi:hypothetical protein
MEWPEDILTLTSPLLDRSVHEDTAQHAEATGLLRKILDDLHARRRTRPKAHSLNPDEGASSLDPD